MRKLICSISILFAVIFLLFSCEDEVKTPETYTVSGLVTSQSTCKNMLRSTALSEIPVSLSKVEYKFYPDSNVLLLKHINTGFNCCSGDLYCNIYTSGDTIFIDENESSYLCNCNCLFDMDIKINGITSKEYHLKFLEPYLQDQAELNFTIDLSLKPEGTYAVNRDSYPWGVSSVQ